MFWQGTPHIWLSVDGVPIDNAHVAFPASLENLEYFYESKNKSSYLQQDPTTTK